MGSLIPVAHILGRLLIVFSATYFFPIIFSVIHRDGTAYQFLYGMAACLLTGVILWLGTKPWYKDLKPRDGFLLVSLVWILMAAIATIPLLLVYPEMSFTEAFFETMSALTTNGASVMNDLENAPAAINIWRHELSWIGGMGIIVLAVAILPFLGVGGMQLYKAETPGPVKDNKLTARIADTAQALWMIYVGLTLVCILCLRVAGMTWLDAICHAFSAASLGGLSTKNANVGAFDSPIIEAILIVFMILGALNFYTHFHVWKNRSLKEYWRDIEARTAFILIVVSTLGCSLYIWLHNVYPNFLAVLRHVSFNLVSVATACGFSSVDYDKWPIFVPLWMLFLSCITANSGSAGGGIKMVRTLILVKQGFRELSRLIHPTVVRPIQIGRTVVPDSVVFAVLAFVFLYFISIVILTFLLVLGGMDFISAFTAVIACINNAGAGLNMVGPSKNYQPLSDFVTWVLSFTMLLGRLEVFSLLVIFTPAFWRK